MIAKLAFRNLARNRWRSLLTGGGIAVAVAMMIWSMSFFNGWMDAMVQGTTALDTLQVKIEREAYVEERAIYHAFELGPDTLDRLANEPGIAAATARVNLYGLIGNEQRSQIARIIGVDPERESAATPVESAVIKGAWLSARRSSSETGSDETGRDETGSAETGGDEPAAARLPRVVLGEVLARQLQVEVGDELVVFLEASDGSLGNELLEVGGVVRTGNSAIDRQAAYVHIDDAQFIGALEGQVHEIALRTTELGEATAVAEALRARVGHLGGDLGSDLGGEHALSVRSWREVQPAMAQMVDMTASSNWVMYFIIYLVACLGIVNTQRMSALERRREFAVMMAIGTAPPRLFRIVVAETVALALTGGLVGTAIGGAVSLYHARAGIDLAMFSDQTSFSYLGVSFADRIYASLDLRTVVEPLVVMLVVAAICGMWPAVQSARINITQALSGRS